MCELQIIILSDDLHPFLSFSSSDFFLYSNDLRVLTGGRSRIVNVGQSAHHFVSDYYASTTYLHEILHSN